LDRERGLLWLAVLCSTTFVVLAFVISYYVWGFYGLPMGWDTPHYIEQANIVARQGPIQLIAVQGPYDFVYQLLSGTIVWLGASAIGLEIVLPIIFSALLPSLLSRLALVNNDLRFATFATIAVPGWFAIYFLGSSLHANLLGLVFVLAAIPFILQSQAIGQPRTIMGLVLIGIASFTHIETTLFFVGLLIILSVAFSGIPKKVAIAAIAVVLPAAIIYVIHLIQLVSLTGYSLPVYTLEPILFWFEIFGPLLPLAIFGLTLGLRGKRTSLESLVVLWAGASILIGLSQYLDPQTYVFAQRAAELVPVPLLAATGLRRLGTLRVTRGSGRFSPALLQRALLAASLILMLVSWPASYVADAPVDQRVFLPVSAYQRLQWINTNMKFSDTPIFVYNDYDINAGGLGDLYDNWVGAIVGTHLSYIGSIGYLVQVQQTPYSNVVSRLHSAIFEKQLRDAGITNRAALLAHPMIIVVDFYNPNPLPTYYATYFNEVSNGVFVGNTTRLATLNNVTISLAASLTGSSGPWYVNRTAWAKSANTLQIYANSSQDNIEASFPLAIYSNGNYTFSLRYWDGSGNDLNILLAGNALGTITYNDTQIPLARTFAPIRLNSGTYSVEILINRGPGIAHFASLDYLSVVES
jgi:hypothetical protein